MQEINQQIRVDGNAAAMQALLQERAQFLAKLMEQDPRAAVESALPDQLRQDLAARFPDAETWLERRGEWTGPLVTSVADDFTHGRSWVTRLIRIEGRSFRLFWESAPAAGCYPSATVRGIRLGQRIAAISGDVTQDTGSTCSSTGEQKTVVLLLNYPSTPLTSGYTPSYVNDVFFGPAPSVSDYWREASYGSTSASGDVFGPFTLDSDYTCAQTDEILQAAIQAADATVDFTAYQHIFLILPVVVSQYCGWDGLAQLGCSAQQSPSKGRFTASVSWIEALTIGPNIFGALGGLLSTAIHEGGHNFGLKHASSTDYDTLPAGPIGTAGVHSEYGDPFSNMGLNPGHFAAPHKNTLGWLSEGTGWLEVASPGTWTLAPLSQQSNAPHALRVQRGTGNPQWLWIEYRQPIGSYEPTVLDNGAPRNFSGALIHLEDPSQTSWDGYTELLDFQPVRLPNDFNNAMLPAGRTWSDPYSNLTLTVGSATPAGLTITVSYDDGCAVLSAGSQSFGPLAGTGKISVSAPSTCAWTAAAAAEWITFTGGQSGAGSGTVSYAVAPNAGMSPRTSMISISHQTFTVTQGAQPQGGSVSVTPASGSGANQTFSFAFSDPAAWTNITSGEVLINATQVNSNACYIHWDAASNSLSLRDDADDAWLGPVPVGGSAELQNSQCVLAPGSASLTGSGLSATLRVTIDFTNRFAGSAKNVYMQAQSVATGVGWQQAGAWTVTFPFYPTGVSPRTGSGYSQVFTFTMAGVYSGDQVNVSFSTSTAFGTLQFYNHGCALIYGAVPSSIFLFNDLASSSTGTSGTLGSGPPLQNSQCSVNLAASSAALSGSTLTLRLAITFTAAFLGRQNVYVFGPGTGWPTGAPYTPVGAYTVTAPPPSAASAALQPQSVVFGAQAVGTTSAAQTVTLTNTGNAALSITRMAIAGAGASWFGQSGTCGTTLNVGVSCKISVTFRPAAAGQGTASLTVTDSAAGGPQSVNLTGTGVGTPVANIQPAHLTFSPLTTGTTSAAQTVILTNSGTAALTIAGIAITGVNASQFGETSACGASLNAGSSCIISVTFRPTALGSQNSALTITDNAAGSPHTVSLSGCGLGTPAAILHTAQLTFGSLAVGSISATQTATLANTGTASLTIASITVAGANASQFADTSGCGPTLNAGGSCSISVTFRPTSPGSQSATLTVTDNAPGSPQKVTLNGTAIAPTASLSRSSLSFALQAVGTASAAQTVTLTNTSTLPLSISKIALSGANASQFAETSSCSGSLKTGASCSASITFRPTLAGNQTASLTITSNAAGSPQSVSLSGTALQPAVRLSRTSLSFGSQAPSTASAGQAISLTNTSSMALTIANVALTGASANQFAETNTCGSRLQAGATCTITVSFHPNSAGNKSASLTITDNAAGGSQSVALSGTGN